MYRKKMPCLQGDKNLKNVKRFWYIALISNPDLTLFYAEMWSGFEISIALL